MARKWKIIIGIVVALVVVACVALPIVGAVAFGGQWHGRRQALVAPRGEWPGRAPQVEVRLVDDDGDGVPDRGVVEFPGVMAPGGRFGGFHPVQRMSPGGHVFGPFLLVRGLAQLALLAVVILLGVAFYRQWRKAHPRAAAPSQPDQPQAA